MLHRFLPISGAAWALAEAGVGLGERLCSCGGQLLDSTHQPYPIRDVRTQLSVSGCSHLPPAHPAIYLSLPHSHLLHSLSLFNFPFKNRSRIKQPSVAGCSGSPEGAKEWFNFSSFLSLQPPLPAHAQIITHRGLIFISLWGQMWDFSQSATLRPLLTINTCGRGGVRGAS